MLTKSYEQKDVCICKKQRDKKAFQVITLGALTLLWIGYAYSLYRGDSNKVSNYSLLILPLSLINSDILFTKKEAENRLLNILAKLHGVLFVILAITTVVSLLLK